MSRNPRAAETPALQIAKQLARALPMPQTVPEITPGLLFDGQSEPGAVFEHTDRQGRVWRIRVSRHA